MLRKKSQISQGRVLFSPNSIFVSSVAIIILMFSMFLTELWQLNRSWVFQGHGASLQPQTMVLDESHERLYVGAKNTLFSLSLDQLNMDQREVGLFSRCVCQEARHIELRHSGGNRLILQKYNQTHLLVCGTGAFNPICALARVGNTGALSVCSTYVCFCAVMCVHVAPQGRQFSLEGHSIMSGRGRCPYDPNSPCTSTLSRGELYIGLYTDYWENDGALCRLNNQTYTRTERDDRQQLNDPKFVGSAVIPDNDDRDDDKVYFFFTELEVDAEGVKKAVYTHVGRVCANDQGGQRMLVNRWSSFLKTRLICSVAGPNGMDTHFDNLEDVFVLKNKDGKNPEIFGLFSTTSAVFKGYAVCVYHMEDIRAVFNGPFAYRERPEHHWTPYEDRVPYPRPGSVINGGGFSSSKDFPDEVLRFVRSHPMMYRPVLPQHRRPILLQTEQGGRKLTQIAVDRVQAQDGHYHVLYIGTGTFITIYNKDTDTMEEVLLEELQVFKCPHVNAPQQQLYVGSEVGVAQVRLYQCDLYGSECADCCLARDPYCAWDGLTCSRYYTAGVYNKRAEERLVYSVESNSTLLECVPRSLQARVLWFLQKGEEKLEVSDERVIMTSHGLLFLRVRNSDAGVYVCQTVEHGYVHTLLRISLHVLRGERKAAATCHPSMGRLPGPSISPRALVPGPKSRLWYKDFLQLIGYREAQKVEEYCERVWCSNKKRKKTKRKYAPAGVEKRGRSRADENTHRVPRHTLDT
uniref:Uncharacterized protein n=1 Tax=Mola mola TaxID=94237 RepID=A0A3Q3WPK4_MOLML